MSEFSGEMGKNISTVSPEVMGRLRAHSMEVIDEYSAADPDYSGRVGALMHEFMKLTGKT